MEFKDVANFLGLKEDEIKTIDDFKSKFDSEFIRQSAITEDSEPVKKILGKTFGTLENEVKKIAKAHELEIDFDAEDLKGKKVTDKFKTVFSRFEDKQKGIIDELSAKASQNNDDKVKDWEKKYEKLHSKYNDTENLLKNTTVEFEGFKQKAISDVKSVKLNVHKAEILSKAKFLPDVNEYTKKGFIGEFESKYKLDLDENEKPIILDKEGKRIPNPKVTGTFYEPLDLLTEELVKAKLYAINPHTGKTTVVTQTQQQASTPVRKAAIPLGKK